MKNEIEMTTLEIGEKMLKSGAEVFRVEDTVKRILVSRGIEKSEVFCISSIIIISDENGTFSKRVKGLNFDLAALDSLNSLSRKICNGEKYEIKEEGYGKILQLLCVILGTGSFCLYFGGTLADALAAGMIGGIINFRKSKINIGFSDTFFDSLLSSLIAGAASLIFPSLHYDKIVIGTIMLLVPGLTVICAVRDIMLSDFISGIVELFDSVFTAISISLGCACALVVINWIKLFFA